MNRKKRVLLKDIAMETGFSINTVSHALSDKPDISEPTKKLIKETAERMGYIGNSFASSLRSGYSKIVTVIIGDISNPHFSIMVKEIESCLRESGYTLFIINTDEDQEKERKAINAAIGKNVDGIIICPSPGGEENIRCLKNLNTPFVLIGRYFENINTDYVVCDDFKGGYLATKHLTDKGYNKILFLNGPLSVSSAKERLAGYKKALNDAGIPYEDDFVYEIPLMITGDNSRIKDILQQRNDYTAVIAFSDLIAWEVIYTLKNLNINVPEDISVVGFDNIQSRFLFPVPVPSVCPANVTMAKKAVELLMQRINNHNRDESVNIVLETKLAENN